MKNFIRKLLISVLTFTTGITSVWIYFVEKQTSKENEPPQSITSKPFAVVNKPFVIAGQKESPQNVEDHTAEIEGLPLNPYVIHKFINENKTFDVNELWKKLEISHKLDMIYPHIGIETDENYSERFEALSGCEEGNLSNLIKLNIDNNINKEVILKLCDGEKVRFLVFKNEGNNWRFIGHADHEVSRYYEPIPSVRKLGDKYFLVFECQGISGTGVSLDYERWFENTKSGLQEVLSIIKKGRDCGNSGSLCRSFEGKVILKKKNFIRVAYKITLTGFAQPEYEKCGTYIGDRDSSIFLLKRNQVGNYKFDETKGEYLLDEKSSTITKKEITTAYLPDALGIDEAVAIYKKEFEQIAKSKSVCKRYWLESWLTWNHKHIESSKTTKWIDGILSRLAN